MRAPGSRRKRAAAAVAAADAAPEQSAALQPPQPAKKKNVNPWSLKHGWKQVDVADEIILGADEYGFAGLEVLEDTSLIDPGRSHSTTTMCAEYTLYRRVEAVSRRWSVGLRGLLLMYRKLPMTHNSCTSYRHSMSCGLHLSNLLSTQTTMNFCALNAMPSLFF